MSLETEAYNIEKKQKMYFKCFFTVEQTSIDAESDKLINYRRKKLLF